MTDKTERPRREYAAPALERGFDIFEVLAERGVPMTVSDIAQALNRSISEVFRIIIVMERRKWLRKGDDDRYTISFFMLDVAYRGTPAQSLANMAAPVMAGLAAATRQSCHLVVRTGCSGLVIHRQENAGPSGFSMRAGAVIDLATSCSGHVLLAFEAPVQQAALLTELENISARDVTALNGRLRTVRVQGFERQASARAAGVTDISTPVFRFDGSVAAALTIPYLTMLDGAAGTTIDDAQRLLLGAGKEISESLGWRYASAPNEIETSR
jgi:DNA-binding IclR family transcriptional regulator